MQVHWARAVTDRERVRADPGQEAGSTLQQPAPGTQVPLGSGEIDGMAGLGLEEDRNNSTRTELEEYSEACLPLW